MQPWIVPLAAGAFLCAATAVAQPPGAAPRQSPGPARPGAPSDQGSSAPQPPSSGSSAAPDSLSHQLNRSGGVIQPPAVGGEGVVSPPNQGTSRTPVIPPPGSPGGSPDVQPK